MKKKKTLLMITWRDIRSPFAGGAEILTHGILKRIRKKYEITVLSSAFPNCKITETIDGIKYLRLGHKQFNYIGPYNWRIYFSVFRYYFKYLRGKKNYDVTIEQINNVPFLYALYANPKTIIYINQLCRENWFAQINRLFAWIGFLFFEPIYLFLLKNKKVITISESTKRGLMRFGFKPQNVKIIRVGTNISPVKSLKEVKKYKQFTLLSIGDIRKMKQTLEQIRAFYIAKEKIPELKLKIAGAVSHDYGVEVIREINVSRFKKDIEYLGVISNNNKKKLMERSHLLMMTSVKEGWGLTVTEASRQGTPAIVYNVDGLRDSVINKKTGLICRENTPKEMAANILKLYQDKILYRTLQKNAYENNQQYTFENAARDFERILESYRNN